MEHGLGQPLDVLLNTLNQEPRLKVNTGAKFQETLVPHFSTRAFPRTLPNMAGVPELPETTQQREQKSGDGEPLRRWRRVEEAPIDSPAQHIRSMARRVEAQAAGY